MRQIIANFNYQMTYENIEDLNKEGKVTVFPPTRFLLLKELVSHS